MPELWFPDPPLADRVVLLRAWHTEDVPANLMGFADRSVRFTASIASNGVLRSAAGSHRRRAGAAWRRAQYA